MATSLESQFGAEFLDEVIRWVGYNFSIVDIFDDRQIEDFLENYAAQYGYVKEDDDHGI